MQFCFWITVQRPWSLIASTGKTKVDCLFLDWLNEARCEEYCACGRTDKGVSGSSAAA